MKKKILFHADDYGRTYSISKKIYNCLKLGNLNSVSVIINDNFKSHIQLKKLKKIKIKLHLNLTEKPHLKNNTLTFLKKLNFVRLLFLADEYKKSVFNEIDYQIDKFVKIYKPNKLMIDGHEHIQMIPWINNYLHSKKRIYKIKEIRNSNELIMIPNMKDLINIRYYRNLLACLTIKILFHLNKKKKLNSPLFSGIIYSGMQNYSTIEKTIRFYKNKKNNKLEILIHPGYPSLKEKSQFGKKYYNFYSSINRKIEYNLCFSPKVSKLFI